MNESLFRTVLVVIGVSQLALAGWMIISPGSFFDTTAGFGVQNDHYIRDAATFPLAMGVAVLLSVRRVSWRVPILAVLTIWYAVHAVNHLVDIGESDPDYVGPVDFAALALSSAFFAYLTWFAAKADVREFDREVEQRRREEVAP